jgi:hypothetical protein
MKTRIKVVENGKGETKYTIQQKGYEAFSLLAVIVVCAIFLEAFVIPLLPLILLLYIFIYPLSSLFWQNIKSASGLLYKTQPFDNIEEAKREIDNYIKKRKEAKEKKTYPAFDIKKPKTTYIKYP